MNKTLLGILLHVLLNHSAVAAEYQIIELSPGQTVDAYFVVNLSGSVYLRIETRSGPGCAEFWWIMWPFGTIKDLGKHCDYAKFEIPGLSDFAVSSKLSAGGVAEPTKLIVAANETVANAVTIRETPNNGGISVGLATTAASCAVPRVSKTARPTRRATISY